MEEIIVISGDLGLWLFSVVATSKVYLSIKKGNAKNNNKKSWHYILAEKRHSR